MAGGAPPYSLYSVRACVRQNERERPPLCVVAVQNPRPASHVLISAALFPSTSIRPGRAVTSAPPVTRRSSSTSAPALPRTCRTTVRLRVRPFLKSV